MTVSSLEQLSALLYGVLAGVICGATASAVNGFREELKFPTAVSMALDLLFWVFAGALMVWFSLRFGDGGIRGYQILAAVCGFCLHGLCLSRLTEKGARMLARLCRLLLSPAAFLMRGARLYIEKIYKKITFALKRVKNGIGRSTQADRVRKKIQKNYKKML